MTDDSEPAPAVPRRAILALAGLTGAVGAAAFWPFGDSDGQPPDTDPPDVVTADAQTTAPTPTGTETPIDFSDLPAPFRLAQSGRVVPLGGNTDLKTTVDPARTDTPLQDAIDAIGREEKGLVLLPPGDIEERGPLVGGQGKTIAGWGMTGTEVHITDLEADGIKQDTALSDDWRYATVMDLRLSGGGRDRRSGSAVHFQSDAVAGFNLVRVDLPEWGGPDPIVWSDGGHWFDSVWGLVKVGNTTSRGNAFQWDHGGSPNSYSHLTLNAGDDGDGKAMEVTADMQATIGSIEVVTQGNDFASVQVSSTTSAANALSIGVVNYEASQSLQRESDSAVVHKSGAGYLEIGKIQVQQTDASVGHGFTARSGEGHWHVRSITAVNAPNAYTRSPLRLHQSLDGRPATYGGRRADITDNAGTHETGLALVGENSLYHGPQLVGTTTLSKGKTTIRTGVTDQRATLEVALGVADGTDAAVRGEVRWDTQREEHVVDVLETTTATASPRVNYHIIKRSV